MNTRVLIFNAYAKAKRLKLVLIEGVQHFSIFLKPIDHNLATSEKLTN